MDKFVDARPLDDCALAGDACGVSSPSSMTLSSADTFFGLLAPPPISTALLMVLFLFNSKLWNVRVAQNIISRVAQTKF